MKTYQLKYGFWTTYNETIFLKQEQNGEGRWHLRVSNIVKFDTKSDLTRRADDNLTACVSLRECMLFLMCVTNCPDADVHVRNDDPYFIRNIHENPLKTALRSTPGTRQKLSQPNEASAKEIEAGKKLELERQSRSRQVRAARREMRAPASSRPLDTLSEKSRDRQGQRRSPPSETSQSLRPKPSGSSHSSSASSRQEVQQTISQEIPKSRSTGSARDRPGTNAGVRSSSKKAKPLTEAEGKKKATSISSSEERRARSQAPLARRQSPSGRVSSSPRRRARTGVEETEEESENEPYSASGDENRPSNTLPLRPSRRRSPQPPGLPPQSAQPSAPAPSVRSATQRPPPPPAAAAAAAAAATASNESTAPAPAQAEGSTRRSTRRRRQQQQQQEPRSPVKKILNIFHRK